MPVNHPININYLQQNQVPAYLSEAKSQNLTPLLLLDHTQNQTKLTNTDQSTIHLRSGLESINTDRASAWCEIWTSRGHWQADRYKTSSGADIVYYYNDDYLIGSLTIPLTGEISLQSISQFYYSQLIDFIRHENKPHLIRMWNYFPDINVADSLSGEELERYQQFCVGRHFAFADGLQYPAASTVGGQDPHLVILFIASNQVGIFLENPLQTCAYHYPRQYSPQSPTFARAYVYQKESFSQLYISGTASIVGHKSQYENDIIGQIKQTIKNLEALIQHVNKQSAVAANFDHRKQNTQSSAIKVYLRKPEDLQKVVPIINNFSPDNENISFLQADICRSELNIEIEMLISNIRNEFVRLD